jgi:hypothetical protein
MTQQTQANSVNTTHTKYGRLKTAFAAFQEFAPYIGYPLAAFGWFAYLLCFCELHDLGPKLGPGAEAFRMCGWCVVSGWLLIRFGAGLFPFSLRLFGIADNRLLR